MGNFSKGTAVITAATGRSVQIFPADLASALEVAERQMCKTSISTLRPIGVITCLTMSP